MQLPIHSYAIEESASSARLVNCYAEQAPPDSKTPVILRRAPGILSFANVGTGPGRGLHAMRGVLYGLSGITLYRIESTGTVNSVGTVLGAGRAFMTDNGTQLMIIPPGNGGYVMSGGATAAITDSDFTVRHAGACKFIDNFAAIVDEGTGQWFITDLADFTSVDALEFATAEGAPDNLLTLEVDHQDVVLIGTESTELWGNTGGSGFPFTRNANGFLELGGAARFGVVKQDQSVCMLASDRTVRRLTDSTWVRISQHGVERSLRDYSRVDDCEAYAYTLDGHLCTVWRFPTANAAWVYDHTTQEWHERETYRRTLWDISGITECYGRIFVQRASTGEIGVLDRKTFKEWGNTLRAEWTYQNIYDTNLSITLDQLEMMCQSGVGLPAGQGVDPHITLELSYDGGRTYPVTMPTRSIGAQGEYRQTIRWNRCGSGRNIVPRGSFSDPVPLTIWDTQIATRIGTS